MNAVAKNLKRLRKQTGLTQEELAERLHVTRQAVSNWETARTQPDVETLTALAEALGTDVNGLIYGPRPRVEGYARYQKKYVVCTAVCVAVVLAERISQGMLGPWLRAYQRARYAAALYGMTIQLLAFLAAGAILPAAASLWRDIRIRDRFFRRGLLVVGLLLTALLLAAAAVLLPPLLGGAFPVLFEAIYQYTRYFIVYIVEKRETLAFLVDCVSFWA